MNSKYKNIKNTKRKKKENKINLYEISSSSIGEA